MTELEQIEIWRAQFESAVRGTAQYEHALVHVRESIFDRNKYLYRYINTNTEALWQGFLLARRSMPAIELPEFFDDPDGCQLFSGSVTGAIETAGCKYTIKN